MSRQRGLDYVGNEWISIPTKSLKKSDLIRDYQLYMFNRTFKMFEYSGLPDTITARDIEKLVQMDGYGCVVKFNDKLYILRGGMGGELNENYMPTIVNINNPYLSYNKTLKIDEDCVIIPNDSTFNGLIPMFNKYSSLLAECDLSLRMVAINTRIPKIAYANNDGTKKSLDEYFKIVEDGEKIGVALKKSLEDNLTSDYGNTSVTAIKDLIEMKQYLLASWFNELGLQSQFNMKRESLNESETTMNDDVLLPLIDDMLEQRKLALEKVNKMFGTNISVDFASPWKQVKNAQEQEESNAEESNEEETKGDEEEHEDNSDNSESND